jgi:hypothetical protein
MDDYYILLITNAIMAIVFCTLSIIFFSKYRKSMDDFMMSKVLCYLFSFLSKPVFWYLCLHFDEEKTIPTAASVVSGITFLSLHIFMFRVRIALNMFQLENEEERQKETRKITIQMYVHLSIYSIMLILQPILGYLNGLRLNNNYESHCQQVDEDECVADDDV